ncbi:MAG: IS1380 family transposase [Candidatus Bipolaricaulota bacterium]|nr:IS1380 family transposase [Candidatus Bipolaricaulota bacterium]
MIKQRKRVVQKDEVAVQFIGKNLTTVGGIGLFHKFAKRLGVEKVLEQKVKLSRRISKYASARILLSLVYAFVLDLPRLSDTLLLRQDKVSHKLVGFDDFPHPSTLSRFLARFTVPKAKGIGKASVALMMRARDNLKKYWRITLDLDSHVKTVYGNQQRAKKGYNTKKPGRKGFHPLFCFIGETRDFLWGRFRPGNRYSGQGAKSFLRECLRLLPRGIKRIRLRADSGFFNEDFLRELEQKRIKYAIAAKLYRPIQYLLGGLDYRDIGGGVSAAEFRYQGTWEKERRMVVIREEVREGKPTKKQPRLIELKGYSFQVIVTNIEGRAPEEVWRFYNGRANVENMIKEGMMGYGLDVTPSHYYGGNAAHFFIVMLAYNLMNWFKELVLEQREEKRMAKWVRRRFLLIAGKLTRRGRKWILTLPRDWPWQKEYLKAEERLMALRL